MIISVKEEIEEVLVEDVVAEEVIKDLNIDKLEMIVEFQWNFCLMMKTLDLDIEEEEEVISKEEAAIEVEVISKVEEVIEEEEAVVALTKIVMMNYQWEAEVVNIEAEENFVEEMIIEVEVILEVE
jgi:hypothetical protein